MFPCVYILLKLKGFVRKIFYFKNRCRIGLQLMITKSNSTSWESCFLKRPVCAHTAPCLLSVPAHAEQNQHVFLERSSIVHFERSVHWCSSREEKKSVHYWWNGIFYRSRAYWALYFGESLCSMAVGRSLVEPSATKSVGMCWWRICQVWSGTLPNRTVQPGWSD